MLPKSFALDPDRKRRRGRPALAGAVSVLFLLAPIAPAADGRATEFRGLTLTRALLELQGAGLKIVFSSEVVKPGMRVETEPVSSDPRRILDELLSPHGLRATEGPEGILIVVRAGGAGEKEMPITDGEPGGEALQSAPFINDEIIVRSSRLSLLQEEPAPPLSLSRDEIESLPQLGGDIFRALSLLPGTSANDVSAQFSVHGGRRDEVRIVLDGQELFDAHHLKEFDNALSVIAADTLSGTSLTTGGFPAEHGDRMSGVLEMTTEVADPRRRTRLGLSLLNAQVESAGTFSNKRGSWLATARRGSIDLATRIFGTDKPTFWDTYNKLEYALNPSHRIRAHFLAAHDALNFFESPEGEPKRFDTSYTSTYVWMTHQGILGKRTLVDTSASWTGISRDRRGDETEEEQSFEVLDRRKMGLGALSQSWSLQASPQHSLKGGAEWRRYEVSYDYFNRADRGFVLSPDLTQPASFVTRFEEDFTGRHLGAFVTDRLSPIEPLTVESGLRYDRHSLTDETLVSPRLSLAWRLGENSLVRGAWGHFFQSQRPYELEIQDGETRFNSAERSEHWILGYERLLGKRDQAGLRALRVEAFRREIDDPRPRFENLFEPVNAFPEIERDRVRIAPDSSLSQGLEITLRGAAGSDLAWWMNYSYSVIEDRISTEDVRRKIDQPHALNLSLDYRPAKTWVFNLAWRYHSGWPTTSVTPGEVEGEDGETEPVPILGPLNAERFPSYHRMDLRASRRWRLGSGQLTFFVDVQNLYDRKNVAGLDFFIDEEEGTLTANVERWVGIFPSAGISWVF